MRRTEGRGQAALRTPVAVALCAATFAAYASPELARQQGCLGCHALSEKLVGPSFAEVTKRYSGKPAAAESLAKNILAGSKGAWGEMAMPPQPQLSAQQADALARWLLQAGLAGK